MVTFLREIKGVDMDSKSETERRDTIAAANVALSNGWSL